MLLFQIIYDLATAVMGEPLPFAAWSNLRASTAAKRFEVGPYWHPGCRPRHGKGAGPQRRGLPTARRPTHQC